MRNFLLLFITLALPLPAQDDYLARAKKLATQYIGIDTHIDTMQRALFGADLSKRSQQLFDAHPEMIEQATSAADIERIVAAGKIAGVLTIEGGHQIDNELPVLRQYRRMGIMAMTLTHFKNNDWADSSTDNAAHNGLTDFGKQVVREMNRIGMIVDVSHVSDKIFFDTLAITTKPVILSHSSCRVISEVPRNVTEEFKRDMAPTKVSAIRQVVGR